jgi:serine/threonine protein kinase
LFRIEYLHSRGLIHRHIKPENFVVDLCGKISSQISITGFDLVKRYRDPETHQHIPFVDQKRLTGTARYASIDSHLGFGMQVYSGDRGDTW